MCDSCDLQGSLRCWPWPPSTPTCERHSLRSPTSRLLTCTWWAALCLSSWPCWSTPSSTTSSSARAPSDRRRRLKKQPWPITRNCDPTPTRCVCGETSSRGICAVGLMCVFVSVGANYFFSSQGQCDAVINAWCPLPALFTPALALSISHWFSLVYQLYYSD